MVMIGSTDDLGYDVYLSNGMMKIILMGRYHINGVTYYQPTLINLSMTYW
jgi:hypothetical protein